MMQKNGTIVGVIPENASSTEGMATYMQVELASAVILMFLCPITIAANTLLLTAIYRDPLRTFRTPTTYFIIGLACSDLLTGVAVEPFFAMYYIAHYSNCGPVRSCMPAKLFLILYQIGGIVSTIAISTSFFVVLALSISQFIAVTYPHKYKDLITKNRAVACVTLSWCYFIAFSLLQFTGIEAKTYLQLDLILHATFISIILAVVHSLLYISFRRHLNRSHTLRRRSTIDRNNKQDREKSLRARLSREKQRLNDRQYTVVTFYLAGILLASASMHTVVLYVYFYFKERSHAANVDIHVSLRLSDLMLFLKVMLDPFIYAWRLPAYRKALKLTLITGTKPYKEAPRSIRNEGLTTIAMESRKIIESVAGNAQSQ